MRDDKNIEITTPPKSSPRWRMHKENDFLITPEKAWENFDGVYRRKLEKISGIKV